MGETGGSEGLQRIDGESQLDWDSIIVSDVLDDEGRVQVPCENEIYFNLGLNKEDEAANNRFSGSGTNCHAQVWIRTTKTTMLISLVKTTFQMERGWCTIG